MHDLANYIRIAKAYSTALFMAEFCFEQGVYHGYEESSSDRRKLGIELQEESRLLIASLEKHGIDATPIVRCTLAATDEHYHRFEDERFACLAYLESINPTELGVSLTDVVLSVGFPDDEVKKVVSSFSKSKKVTAKSIGKCPKEGRANLYRLFEILKNWESFSPLSKAEKNRAIKHLEAVKRQAVAKK
jgi:hypothetical protein